MKLQIGDTVLIANPYARRARRPYMMGEITDIKHGTMYPASVTFETDGKKETIQYPFSYLKKVTKETHPELFI